MLNWHIRNFFKLSPNQAYGYKNRLIYYPIQ